MPIPWDAPIRKGKQLSIFPGAGLKSGTWAKVMADAIVEFNKLSVTHKLGVTYTSSSTAPSTSGSGGADVSFDTANGSTSFMAFGQTFSVKVDGNALIGRTQQIKTLINNVQAISKAFIFVPATPKAFSANGREVGDPVKLVMAVHELIHACGLTNSDHSNDDVFFGFPSLSTAKSPSGDRVTVGQVSMPPIILSAATAKTIQSIW